MSERRNTADALELKVTHEKKTYTAHSDVDILVTATASSFTFSYMRGCPNFNINVDVSIVSAIEVVRSISLSSDL